MYSTQVYDAAGETIATLAWYPVKQQDGITTTSRDANARLIAAAPELLAALKDILPWAEDDQEAPGCAAARVAIAKAQGR